MYINFWLFSHVDNKMDATKSPSNMICNVSFDLIPLNPDYHYFKI